MAKLGESLWVDKKCLDSRLVGTKSEIQELIEDNVFYPGAQVYCTDEDQFYTIKKSGSVTVLEPSSSSKPIPSTWQSLKNLKSTGGLTPGTTYRITDYNCFLPDELNYEVHSALHQFDILVTASSNNTLFEEAGACLHNGDTYFSNCKLNTWKIWYCLENDTNRFEWATTNGKGVIYKMIDEFGNECPYDFKNIQFKRADRSNLIYKKYSQSGSNKTIKLFGSYTVSSQTAGSMVVSFSRNQSNENPYLSFSNKTFTFVKQFDDIQVWSGYDDSGNAVTLYKKNSSLGHRYEYNMIESQYNPTTDLGDSNMDFNGIGCIDENNVKIILNRDENKAITKYIAPVIQSSTINYKYLYTFSIGNEDASIINGNKVYNNIIKSWVNDPIVYPSNGTRQRLNNIVFYNNSSFVTCSSNKIDFNSHDLTIGSNCRSLKLDTCCKKITIEDNCKCFHIGSHNKNTYICKNTDSVNMGLYCMNDTIGPNCDGLEFSSKVSYCGCRSRKVNKSFELGKKDAWI